MNEDDIRHQLLEETRRVLDRQVTLRETAQGQGEKPPEPGDVFVLDRTADYDVEWAVIAQDPADARRLLTVPADGCSLVGSTDVEVSEAAPVGPLVLRCRFGRWLNVDHFDPGSRVGVLDPDDIARARHKCSEVEDGAIKAAVVTLEIDDNPEYLDWVEDVLLPAQLALAGPLT